MYQKRVAEKDEAKHLRKASKQTRIHPMRSSVHPAATNLQLTGFLGTRRGKKQKGERRHHKQNCKKPKDNTRHKAYKRQRNDSLAQEVIGHGQEHYCEKGGSTIDNDWFEIQGGLKLLNSVEYLYVPQKEYTIS